MKRRLLHKDVEVKIPKKCVLVEANKGSNVKYVYYLLKAYRIPNTNSVKNERVCIGRCITDKTMNPNSKYYELFKDTYEPNLIQINRSYPIKHYNFGNYFLIKKIIEKFGIDKLLDMAYIKSDQTLAIAQFILDSSSVMNDADVYFSHNCSFYNKSLKSQRTSEILLEVDRDNISRFLRFWIDSMGESECTAVDSTSIYSYSENITLLNYGYNKQGNKLKQFQMVMAYGLKSELPLCYELTDGSLTDKSSFTNIKERFSKKGLNIKSWVLDGGYLDISNLKTLDDNGESFIIPLRKDNIILKEHIKTHPPTIIEDRDNRVMVDSYYTKSGKPIKETLYGLSLPYNERFNILLYYSIERKSDEATDFNTTLDSNIITLKKLAYKDFLSPQDIETTNNLREYFHIEIEQKDQEFKLLSYSEKKEVIRTKMNSFGYFAFLVNDKTHTPTTGQILYSKRENVEDTFDNLLNRLSLSRIRVHSTDTLQSKIFHGFVSLIIKTHIEHIHRDYKIMYNNLLPSERSRYVNLSNISSQGLLKELSKIELFYHSGHINELNETLTKKEKAILALFNLTEKDLLQEIKNYKNYYNTRDVGI
jgi:hypothetical protein